MTVLRKYLGDIPLPKRQVYPSICVLAPKYMYLGICVPAYLLEYHCPTPFSGIAVLGGWCVVLRRFFARAHFGAGSSKLCATLAFSARFLPLITLAQSKPSRRQQTHCGGRVSSVFPTRRRLRVVPSALPRGTLQ